MKHKTKLKKIYRHQLFVPSLLLAAGVLIIIATLALNYKSVFKHNPDTAVAGAVGYQTDVCAQTKNITYSCYKKELTDLTIQKGPEYATAIVKQGYPNIQYVQLQCHQLMHTIGRAALTKYKDLATTYVHGDQFCASGYYHGASEEIIAEKGANYMVKNAGKICAKFKSGQYSQLDYYNCVHGIGHGLMEATNGDLFASLKGCDNLATNWEHDSCYSGVFMQNVMIEQSPDESIDHKSAYLDPSQPMYPCTAVADRYKGGCYNFQTSYALTVVNYDFPKVFDLCTTDGGPKYRDTCYGSLGRDASGASSLNNKKTADFCYQGPNSEAIGNCLDGAAKNIVYSLHSDNLAYSFCEGLKTQYRIDCIATVKDFYSTF